MALGVMRPGLDARTRQRPSFIDRGVDEAPARAASAAELGAAFDELEGRPLLHDDQAALDAPEALEAGRHVERKFGPHSLGHAREVASGPERLADEGRVV